MLVDIGVNLTSRQFESDRYEVIQRALDAGVHRMVVTGTNIVSSEAALQLANECPGTLWSTAGIHPHDASEFGHTSTQQLQTLCAEQAVVAVGECGLDHNRDYSPRDAQADCFEAQLLLAADLGLPVFMHQRDAHNAFMEILKPFIDKIPKGVVHCFTGSQAELDDYLAQGLYIGVTGWICDERRGGTLRELVRRIPMDRILVETDAPYLIPRDLKPRPKSRRNEPHYLPHIVSVIAACMDVTPERLAAESTRNALEFFGLG